MVYVKSLTWTLACSAMRTEWELTKLNDFGSLIKPNPDEQILNLDCS